VVSLLRQHSSRAADDTRTFAQALAFNWLIAGTDAHAKNYSLLHGPRQRVRLAPLYDIASVLPYPEYSERRAKLAMKIGNSYRLQEIARADWEKLGQELGLDAGALVAENIELARRIGASALEVQRSLTAAGLEHPLLDRLTIAIAARARSCLRLLGDSG
jgi:serine/threonine-protein kinase HipA